MFGVILAIVFAKKVEGAAYAHLTVLYCHFIACGLIILKIYTKHSTKKGIRKIALTKMWMKSTLPKYRRKMLFTVVETTKGKVKW